MLTYHVSLLMHHHPQVLEDVIDICDVSLNKGHEDRWFTQLCLSYAAALLLQTSASYLYLQLPDGRLSLLDQPQVFFSDGLGLSLHLGVTAGTNIDAVRIMKLIMTIMMIKERTIKTETVD